MPLPPARSVLSAAVCYPNTYYTGMSNLGVHAVYRLLRQQCGVTVERAFLPDPTRKHDFQTSRTPLFSLETQRDLAGFHLLGFSLQFEHDYANVVTMLRLAGVPVHAVDREDSDPVVLAGGPCATYNPLPLADLVDAFVIGDAEPVLPGLTARLEACMSRGGVLSRNEALAALTDLPGVFVPDADSPNLAAHRRAAADLTVSPASTVFFTPATEFADMNLIEISRGCRGRCRFCVTGHGFGPQRSLPTDAVLAVAEKARPFSARVGLIGPSVTDHPELEDLCEALRARGFEFSVTSLRLEQVSTRLLRTMAAAGQKSTTLAPEAGTLALRRRVGKRATDEQLIQAVARAAAAGIQRVRLYFMIGLPMETDADVEALVPLVRRLRSETAVRYLDLSVSVFVPKPGTPFAREPMTDRHTLDRRGGELRAALRHEPGVTVKVDSTRWAFVQAVLAQGGRNLGEAIIAAEAAGGSWSAWRRALATTGVDLFETPTKRRTASAGGKANDL